MTKRNVTEIQGFQKPPVKDAVALFVPTAYQKRQWLIATPKLAATAEQASTGFAALLRAKLLNFMSMQVEVIA